MAVAKYWGWPFLKYLWEKFFGCPGTPTNWCPGKVYLQGNAYHNKDQSDSIPLSPPANNSAMEQLLNQQLTPKLVIVDIDGFAAEVSTIVLKKELPWMEGTFGLVLMAVAKYWGWPFLKYLWEKVKLKLRRVSRDTHQLVSREGNAYHNKDQSDSIPLSPTANNSAMEQLLNQQLTVLKEIKVSVTSMEPHSNDRPQEFVGQPTGPGEGDQ
ncbi:hypothetical protein DAPPUDRAFT_268528 [Daphnia pulex]|uniref:Uncharacterized protein n=1 Tax=Daphnia pulex TaxID=6669 RepID=E9HXY4_DAPPU|nr:hypothetical protein DAPPUDRAFT_268528 [Daphnia pulex]|eukprot:EFX63396.1 hypothetical protein DAPPUDRAFT_268528 [Daphnia pulex]